MRWRSSQYFIGLFVVHVALYTGCTTAPVPEPAAPGKIPGRTNPSHSTAEAAAPRERPDLPTDRPLSCLQVVERAWQVSGARIALEHDAEASYHEGREAGAPRNPELRLGYGQGSEETTRTYYTDPFWPYERDYDRHTDSSSQSGSATLRIFPRHPMVLKHAKRRASSSHRTAELSIEAQRRRNAQSMAGLFVQYLFAQQSRTLAEQALAAAQSTAAASTRALEAGALLLDQHARNQRRILDAMAMHSDIQRTHQQLGLALGSALQVDPRTVDLAQDLDWLGAAGAIPLDACIALAATNRIDAQIVAQDCETLRSAFSMERARLIPWISFVEGAYRIDDATELTTGRKSAGSPPWQQLPDTQVYPGMPVPLREPSLPANISADESEGSEWRVRLGVELPIFTLFSHADNAAKSHYLAAVARREDMQDRIRSDVEAAHAELRDMEQTYGEYQAQCRAAAIPLAKALATAREQGGVSDLQMGMLRADALELTIRKLDARRRLFMARLRLMERMGLTPVNCEREILRVLSTRVEE